MAIRNETKEIKVCDLCGKEEGKHLKPSDFFIEAPTVVVKNHAGIPLSFQLNIDVYEEEARDEVEDTLDDIIETHGEFQNPQPQQPNPYIKMIPVGMIHMPNEQLEGFISNYIVCKGCYNNLVNMIQTYGKFDRVENF